MSRIDRPRLTNGVFPFTCQMPTRFTDLDVQGHVNNVAMAGIVQEARARFSFAHDFGGYMKGRSLAVVSLTIEFAAEAKYPDPVELSVGVIEVGRTSYRLGATVKQNGRIAAFAEIVLVASKDGVPVPFDDEWRAKLESLKIS